MSLRFDVLSLLGLGLAVASLAVPGCDVGPSETEPLARAAEEIQGQDDTTDTAVVAVFRPDLNELCSGSIIAPNLVLTARHCISTVDSEPKCGVSKFGANASAANVFVSTKAVLEGPPAQRPDDYHAVRQIVTSSDNAFCGNDMALLILSDNIAASEAVPFVALIDSPIATNASYSAVGFGTTDDVNGAGRRRRLDNLAVACSQDSGQCKLNLGDLDAVSDQSEWHGSSGACEGDSGGPALDKAGHVIGVLSRGSGLCGPAVYSSVTGDRADLITDTVAEAAKLGKYTVPTWAKSTGCAVAAVSVEGSHDRASYLVFGAFAMLIVVRRRTRNVN